MGYGKRRLFSKNVGCRGESPSIFSLRTVVRLAKPLRLSAFREIHRHRQSDGLGGFVQDPKIKFQSASILCSLCSQLYSEFFNNNGAPLCESLLEKDIHSAII